MLIHNLVIVFAEGTIISRNLSYFQNGFKCHCMSESHQRQLLLFADNPDKFLDAFSK